MHKGARALRHGPPFFPLRAHRSRHGCGPAPHPHPAQAFRAPERRKKRASPHPAAPHAGPRSSHHPAPEAPPRAPVSRRGRRVPAPAARAMDAALLRPPHGVSVSSALPAQETRLAAPTPARRRATRPHQPSGGSEGPRGPSECIRIARLRRAGGEFAPGAQTFLTPLPAREPSEGGREGSGATPSEKAAAGGLFRRAFYALNCA